MTAVFKFIAFIAGVVAIVLLLVGWYSKRDPTVKLETTMEALALAFGFVGLMSEVRKPSQLI